MSIVVRPAHWMTLGPDWESVPGEYKPTLPGDFLGIECDAVNPSSMKGRKVYVFLDEDDVVWLLRQLRAHLIEGRSKPMPA